MAPGDPDAAEGSDAKEEFVEEYVLVDGAGREFARMYRTEGSSTMWRPEHFSTFQCDGYTVLACVVCGDEEFGTTLWIMDDAHPMREQLARMMEHAAVCEPRPAVTG